MYYLLIEQLSLTDMSRNKSIFNLDFRERCFVTRMVVFPNAM